MDEFFITPISKYSYTFPNPREASQEGLLAYGGDLSPNRLLNAYRHGIFPWYNEDDPILWWSPNPRLVLYINDFKITKSFRKVLKNKQYKVYFDRDFRAVMRFCANTRKFNEGTWLIDDMQEAYAKLHEMGFAHSVEVYDENDEFFGGLYGVSIGKVFFGESMVSLKSNGSKIALKALSDVLESRGYDFIDCQVPTEHLQKLGAKLVDRDTFLDELSESVSTGGDIGSWSSFKWEYNDGR